MKTKLILFKKNKLFLNLNLIKLNSFAGINNFLFRFILLESLIYSFVADYFFMLFLLTIPISFYNSHFCDYISYSIKKLTFFILISIIFYLTITFLYFFKFYDLIDFQIYFLHLICCLLFLLINFTRYKMINDPVTISQFMRLDLVSSICFLTILLLSFGFEIFLIYIFCINSILQLFLYKNYIFTDLKKIIFKN